MKRIPIAIELTPQTLERLDTAVRLSRRRAEPLLEDMERNELLHLAIELGLRQIEARVHAGPSIAPPSSQFATVPPPQVRVITQPAADNTARTRQTVRGRRLPL